MQCQQRRVPRQDSDQDSGERATRTYDDVLRFCETPRSLQEIVDFVGMKSRRWVRKKYLAPMLGSLPELTIPDKPNSKYQKYRRK